MYWVKVDLSEIPDIDKDREFTSYVWELARREEGPEYEQARFHGQSLGVISNPPGFVAQVDWGKCRVCRQPNMTVKGLCRKCRGPLL
ncbi:MAG: hypothetical protein ACT4OM_13685 [Actinomycetota bacterium]